MWYGWTGTELEVDLSQDKVEKRQGDREMYQTYLGGRGLITKLFWDRVPPETAPFSPDNLLIFGAGPPVGTVAPAANRTNLVTRSPLTNYLTFSSMGGFWGPGLKFAGYDTLILSGKSPSPVYIYINNDKVEIRDASHLWGKGVFQTQQMIRAELKNKEPQIICIGPAGENKVFFASIEHGPGSSFSRAGVGAIMGDKKVKAIVVQGTKDVNLANPTAFFELCDEINSGGEPGRQYRGGAADHDTNPNRGKNLYRNFELLPKSWKGQAQHYEDFLEKRGGCLLVASIVTRNASVPLTFLMGNLFF